MSLIISLIEQEGILVDTDFLEKQLPAPHNNLFGFESCRATLWGNDCIRELGCALIYSLRSKDIVVFDEAIETLKNELLTMMNHLEIIKLHTDYDIEFIEFRIKNALEMIEIALKEKNRVGIAIG
jgi:hypothetical protein